MALPSAAVEEGVNKVFSHFSPKLDKRASRAHTITRIEMAVSRIYFVLEKTGRIAITHVSLLHKWKIFKRLHMEGVDLLNKYKPQQEHGHAVVMSSCYYLHRFAKGAKNLAISTLVCQVNEHLSPSVAQNFETYADWAEKFLAKVESNSPLLRHDTFRYPYLWHLFQGKTLHYETMKGSKQYVFFISPVILEGRGIEALLGYMYLDLDRIEKSFWICLMLRISESTDIVGAAINCLRSSASLLNPVSQDAAGQLTELHNFQDMDIGYSFESAWDECGELYPKIIKDLRPDPLCCQAANGHEPSINSIISSELSQISPEQTIAFAFQCYLPMLECSLASASDKALGNAMVDRRGGPHPLEITYCFVPHQSFPNSAIYIKLTNKEGAVHVDKIPGDSSNNLKESIDMARRGVIDLLTDELPDVTSCEVLRTTEHGSVKLIVKKPREGIYTDCA